METIQALLVRVHHKSERGDWKVCELRFKGLTDLFGETTFRAAGKIPDSGRDEVLELQGEWETHEKYGRQFAVKEAAVEQPHTLEGLERYLASSARVRGCGPALAAKIVKHFGHELWHVLEHTPARLREMGLDDALIMRIDEAWNTDRHLRPIMLLLEGHSINGRSWAKRIYNELGANSPQIITKNPYRLTKVGGIGFNKADEMAQKMGWSDTSPERTEAAFMYALEEATNKGHVFLYRGELLEAVSELAGRRITAAEDAEAGGDGTLHTEALELDIVDAALREVVDREEVIEEVQIVDGNQVILNYMPRLHYQEEALAKRIIELLAVPARPSTEIVKLIADGEKALNITLSDKQQRAVIAALMNSFSIITGGPGVGKTTVTRVVLYCMTKLGWTVDMAAPTGRAAKRMQELTGQPASTVHRLLGYENGQWGHNRHEPLSCNALILDEWSMGDTDLTYRVMEAVPDGCHVVMIGDVDQLPSVGPGMILRDLIDSDCVSVTRLDQIFRQAQGSLIIRNAHKIIHGVLPEFPAKGDMEADNFVMYVPQVKSPSTGRMTDDVEWIYERLRFLAEYLPERYGVNALTDIQVMAPMKKGTAGTEKLNEILHDVLNPNGVAFYVEGKRFYIGDRVMQMKNNYQLGIFNGDSGVIQANDEENDAVRIAFDEQTIMYPHEKLRELQLSFACTVHKLQGSELPVCIVILLGQHYTMLQRNLVYTALTRAKRMCLFITSKRALAMAVKACDTQRRNSFLGNRVKQSMKRPQLSAPAIPAAAQMTA